MERKEFDFTGQRFGNRLIIRNYCVDEDWTKIGKPIPTRPDKYVLGKCLNCGSVLPTMKRNLRGQPPKRCVFCSNIGNHYSIPTDTNSWVTREDIAICNVIYHDEVVSFYIDIDKYDEIKKYVWRISKKKNKYYVISGSKKKNTMIYLHQMIMGEIRENMEIDHIDGNSLNNRKANLRWTTRQENIDNIKGARIDNKIGIRGISREKRSGLYIVDFQYHNQRYYMKPWSTLEEAVYCRYFLEKHFGQSLIEKNPLAKHYWPTNSKIKKHIEEYVLEKIS